MELTASCDLSGAAQVTSEQPGARRYVRVERSSPTFAATRFYVFPGGCLAERFQAAQRVEFASTASLGLGFVTRQELQRELDQRSGGRLRLDAATR